MGMNRLSFNLTIFTLYVLSFAIFVSNSLSAGSHILAVIPGFYFLYKFIKDKKINLLPKSTWALFLILISIFLSVLFNFDIIERPLKHILKGKYYLFGIFWTVMFYYGSIEKKITQSHIKKLLWVFLISTSVASLSGLIALYTGTNYLKMKPACHSTRACGLYGMYMTYGYGISLFVTLNLATFFHRKKIQHLVPSWLISGSLIINLLGLYFSYARGGILAFVASVPFLFIRGNIKKFTIIFLLGTIALGAGISFIPKLNKTFLDRSLSNQQRISFYQTAIKAFKEKPIFGYGFKNFEPNVKRLKEKYNISFSYFGGHAHNNFLEHLASTGILGALFLVLFHLFWLIELYKRVDIIALITLPFVINFSVSGLFQYTFGDGENVFLIMAVYAISMITQIERKEKAAQ